MSDIKYKLLEKAGFIFWGSEPWRPRGAMIDWSCDYDQEILELIDLIVIECSNVVHDKDAAEAIKNHFGVE